MTDMENLLPDQSNPRAGNPREPSPHEQRSPQSESQRAPYTSKSQNSREYVLKALSQAAEELTVLLRNELVGLALFGSWARGEARPDSDVDVFVVLRSVGGMASRSRIYSALARSLRMPVTLIDIRESELLKCGGIELTPLLVNVVADAVVIRDDRGVLESFIQEGLRLIEKAEFVRYRTPDGRYGWRRKDTKPISLIEL